MPRPTRSQGRPGSRIIPKNWETSHAPAVGKLQTAECVIRGLQPTEPVYDPALGYSVTPPPPILYTGSARIQVLSDSDATALMGEQEQKTATYLVAINRVSGEIPVGATIAFTTISDPTLAVRVLTVAKVDRGSLRFERDLYAIDDLSQGVAP